MTSRVLNFLWLNLDLPAKPDPADGTIRDPMPAAYIENVRKAAERSPTAQMMLWVDSKRLTGKQMTYLKEQLESGMDNVQLKDLRSIPAYDREDLFNKGETNPKWRDLDHHNSLIWRQVDCAKILISLQGNYDQAFFTDFDHAHLPIESEDVQTMLNKHGLMIGSTSQQFIGIENQLWGFTAKGRSFFENYYEQSLAAANRSNVNAWGTLVQLIERFTIRKDLYLKDICLPIDGDGSCAEHPLPDVDKKETGFFSTASLTTPFNASEGVPATTNTAPAPQTPSFKGVSK